MAYEKTAKDKAWDRERVKLHAEIQKWENAYNNNRCLIYSMKQK